MTDIRAKIAEILNKEEDFTDEFAVPKDDLIETHGEYEYEELYSDIYVIIKNIEDFYGDHSHPKAAALLESFLLETMIVLKEDPEVIVVESGDFFCRSTSFTPDSKAVMHLFENVVWINSMAELYNQALTDVGLLPMELGIGVVTFPREAINEELEEERYPGSDIEFDYGIDFQNTAMKLAIIANTEGRETIIVNDMAYDFLLEVDRAFFEENLVKEYLKEEEMTVFHGNIVTDDI
ncbi:MAG: hypothetical protein ACOX16_00700 [Candidatus Izemoplasmatales bacterium]|jgi:hypothetical protein